MLQMYVTDLRPRIPRYDRWPGFMVETLHKGPGTRHPLRRYGCQCLKDGCTENSEMPRAGIPMLLSEFNASAEAVLQLQLATVSRRSAKILDRKGDVPEEVEVLEKKPVDTSVCYELRNKLSVSTI